MLPRRQPFRFVPKVELLEDRNAPSDSAKAILQYMGVGTGKGVRNLLLKVPDTFDFA